MSRRDQRSETRWMARMTNLRGENEKEWENKTRQRREQAWRRSPGKHGRLAYRVTSPRGSHSQHMLPY